MRSYLSPASQIAREVREGPVGNILFATILIYASDLSSLFRIQHGKNMVFEGLVFDLAMPLDEAGQNFLDAINERFAMLA